MSNFELLYKNNNDYNKTFSPSTNNYFEKEIKEGLPFFQQNKLKSTLRNNYFNSNNESYLKMSSNEKMDLINLEAKKIIEREMNPYISLMKKELNLMIDKFSKDFQNKEENINALFNIKNEIEEIKRQNENIINNLEQKIVKNSDNYNEMEQKVKNMQLDIDKINQLFSIQLDNSSSIPNLTNDIYKLKQNLNLQETTIQKLFSEQKTNTEQSIIQKFNTCINNINNIKEENETLKNQIEELNNTIRQMKIKEAEKNEEQINKNNNNQELNNLVKQIQLELTNKENKIKNLEDLNEINKKKLEQINKNIEIAFSNINTEHASIITVANELKNAKNDIQIFENIIENTIYKKDFLDKLLDNLNEKIETQNEKIKEINLKANENINEKNNKLSLDLARKLEENKKFFENHYDELEGNISSINNTISEITTTLQTHPVLNMTNNEIINFRFKENQMKYNEIFKKAIKEMEGEIGKIKASNKNEEMNQKIELIMKDNFDKINEEINNMKQYPELINKIKNDLNIRINLLQQQIPKENIENEKIDLQPINILKKEINRISKDLKNVKEEKIPEILILIENLKSADNSNSNNIIKKEENTEISLGNRRRKAEKESKEIKEMSNTWSRRNNGKSIFDSIKNINKDIILPSQQNEDNNNDINNSNELNENISNNNFMDNVKKFMEENNNINNRINVDNIKEENNESENLMNNNREFNNEINKPGNEDEYGDFNYNITDNNNPEQNNINVNISNNNQSNYYGLNSSNNNISKGKDETDKFIENIINDNKNDSKQNINEKSNEIKFEENFDDDDLNLI